ncbi:L-asparaginase II [Alternaria rosae]|uniref:L-asparaginase II n=1 Tax=Alternaria rosae TaxID=1187941 RepID=UPI001E8E5D29|nr:L-asparaginase II [Alternaria rosae]KAH6865654.1 L-asparaginase II [Alternaria rosae]
MVHATEDTNAKPQDATISLTQSAIINDGAKTLSENDVVISYRGGIIENRHSVHAVVVDASGKPLYTVGDYKRMTLARSSTKPIQTLAILETGAAERFDYDDADVALMCASHSSEPRHIERARAMLKKTGEKEEVLTCGGHPAQNPAVNRAWIKEDYTPTAICNNCSGKHVGMVAGAVCLGATAHDYYLHEHPMQQRVYRAVEDVSGLTKKEVLWTVDGCNLPTPAMPLPNLALMFARLADAADLSDDPTKTTLDQRTRYLALIHKCMASYPGLVAGEGRFDTALMTPYSGQVVGKIGADACYAVAVRASPDANLAGINHGAIGIAVKVEDGNLDVLYAAVMEILEQLNIGSSEVRRSLDGWRYPKIVNTAGAVTGGYEHCFKVRSAASVA